jgi:multidrug efflux pump subunit AcrB
MVDVGRRRHGRPVERAKEAKMWLVMAALRRPITVLVAALGILLAAVLSIRRMPRDLFPELGRPVLYLVETWPGMTPLQMEGLIAARFDYHFLYLAGIEHIETRTIANTLLTKLYFQPDTDTSYAVAQTVAMAYRATATMPKGTLPPFIMRLDGGSYPIANLVFESPSRSDSELQDLVFYRVRPMLATMDGVSAPPPIGGAPRMVMVTVDPRRLRQYAMSPEEVVAAMGNTNLTLPKGSAWIDDRQLLVESNLTTARPEDLDDVPLRTGSGATVYLRDVGRAEMAGDVLTNTALVDGRHGVHMPLTKRAGASTLGVIEAVRARFPDFRAALPPDVSVRLEFDQSGYVVSALKGLVSEAFLGAFLTGLAVLLFLRDLRSALVVVLSIPTSILTAVIVLSLAGQTINLMTLGGLVLAVGVLVDEATVAIENVSVHLATGKHRAVAVRDAMREVQVPRLVATLCICAVFIPAFYMVGTPRALFASLALSVGLAMVSSFLVSSTLVPVMSVWLLRSDRRAHGEGAFRVVRRAHAWAAARLTRWRYLVAPLYLAATGAALVFGGARLPEELFPRPDSDYLQLRIRAPQGTELHATEGLVRSVIDEVSEELGPGAVTASLADIGSPPPLYPSDAVYVFNTGPDTALTIFGLANRRSRSHSIGEIEDALRKRLARRFPSAAFSFERADVLSQVLGAGSPSPVDVVVVGQKLKETRQYTEAIRDQIAGIPGLRDLAIPAPLDSPAVKIDIDRERAAQLGATAGQVGRALASANWSSQMVNPLFWVDRTGNSYFVSVRADEAAIQSIEDVRNLPVMASGPSGAERPLLRDVATVELTKTQGEFAHWDSRRCLHITANTVTTDLAGLAKAVRAAIARAGTPPTADTKVLVRGEIQQMEETLGALQQGLVLAIVVVLLLLAATFQSVASAVAIMTVIPAVLAGVLAALAATRTSLNVQSSIGAIMAVGVAMANSVLLVQFFHDRRRAGADVMTAARDAAAGRLRAIAMTSLCMVAGMVPMALGIGESGEQNAALGRAVVGGLVASTLSTLFVLPAMLAVLHRRAAERSPSLDPGDPESEHYVDRGSVLVAAAEHGGGA